jgi:predicted ATPase/DNA-binding CsgD family transcriptional regulator
MPKRALRIEGSLVEPITHREREFLALLADFRLAINDISNQMTISLNSARWYARQVYAKLGVNSRSEAVQKAIELNLITENRPENLPQTNLPAPLTTFIGREKEIAQVKQKLTSAEVRILTLTGTGGVGKTRLALQVANELLFFFKDGIFLVELASLINGNRIVDTAAAALKLVGSKDKELYHILTDFLKTKKLLLILDNCEHLIEPLSYFAIELLKACPNIKILATSREALVIPGERKFIVPPLAFPSQTQLNGDSDPSLYDAVNLFVDRARFIDPAFHISSQNSRLVGQICQKLDGIPLALELAAARLKVLDINQIAKRLDENFSLLSGGGRTTVPRHKTIQASIDWSYQLLTQEQKDLFCLLSVFAGGWTIEAAQAVYQNYCQAKSPQSPLSTINFLDLYTFLIDKSLIVLSSNPHSLDPDQSECNQKRFRMLEPIHQFGVEKLAASSFEPIARDCQLTFFLQLAEKTETTLRSLEQAAGIGQVDLEIDNFRHALAWALKNNIQSELCLASALMQFWHLRGRWNEGVEWLMKGLEAGNRIKEKQRKGEFVQPQPNQRIRARALKAAGFLQGNHSSDDYENTSALLRESLTIYQSQKPQDVAEIAFILLHLARIPSLHANLRQSIVWANQSFAAYRNLHEPYGMSEALLVLAGYERNTARAQEALIETLQLKKVIGDINGIAQTFHQSAELALTEGKLEQARDQLINSQKYYRQLANDRMTGKELIKISWVSWMIGDWKLSLANLAEAQILARAASDTYSMAQCFSLLADINRSIGDFATAEINTEKLFRAALEVGGNPVSTLALLSQAKNEIYRRNYPKAINHLLEIRALERAMANHEIKVETFTLLGEANFLLGNLPEAASFYQKCLVEAYADGDWHFWVMLAFPLAAMARLAYAHKDFDTAALLFGAAFSRLPFWQNAVSPERRAVYQEEIASLHSILGEEKFSFFEKIGLSYTPAIIIQNFAEDQAKFLAVL